MKLSVIIPAYNEESSISRTVLELYNVLNKHQIKHEILVVNDNSSDHTGEVLANLKHTVHTLNCYKNTGPNGFGYAVRYGLNRYSGDCVAIMMADLSDDPYDLVKFYHRMIEGNFDCVFGSRFMKGGQTLDYPRHKLLLNRIANNIIRVVIATTYNDATNAFKLYKRSTIEGIKPLISSHYNLTIELSLKCIVRGFTFDVLPNSWKNRKAGISKLKIVEMGSRYFFILMYCFIEKYFSKGDYKKNNNAEN